MGCCRIDNGYEQQPFLNSEVKKLTAFEKVRQIGIIPVIKIPGVEYAVPLARTLKEAGLPLIEVTMRNECALDCIREIKRAFPDMLVAAGTTVRPEQVSEAKEAGADMCVAPGLNEAVVHAALQQGMPILPGCVTATEIEQGLKLGLTTFKFFPAELMGGVKTIKELTGPYYNIEFIPTSGINFETMTGYLANPKVAAVGGSFMAPAAKVLAKDWEGISQLCHKALEICQKARTAQDDHKPQEMIFHEVPGTADQTGTVNGKGKVVGFGDFLVRLSPQGYLKFIQADSFDINYTGAEANVLVSLACMGLETEFVTRLPDNAIADSGIAMMRKFNVGTRHIVKGGERMGVFYLEKGASQRPSRIVYDRKYSGIAMAQPGMFDWDKIFEGASHFHITGITPALGDQMPAVTVEAVKAAKAHGVTVSCDLNYRKNMWTPEQARACMEEVVRHVDILIANEEDADKVLGIKAADTDVISGKLNKEGYVDVARQLCETYGVKEVGITLRKSISASDNEWGALLYSGGKPYFSRTYPIHIVDRVGGGDSFAAGLLYGSVKHFDPQKKIEYAAAASCLKHSIEMDFNLSSVAEIELLMNGDASGRVQR